MMSPTHFQLARYDDTTDRENEDKDDDGQSHGEGEVVTACVRLLTGGHDRIWMVGITAKVLLAASRKSWPVVVD